MRWQIVDAMATLAVFVACGVAVAEVGRPTWWQWTVVAAVAVCALVLLLITLGRPVRQKAPAVTSAMP